MRVLFIDRWAKHAIENRFKPLSELGSKSDSFVLLHYGSVFDEDWDQILSTKKGQLAVKDISYYKAGGKLPTDIIDKEAPDIIVFSGSVNQPIFQAFILSAKQKNIPIGVMQFAVYPTGNKRTESFKKSFLKLRNFKKYKYNFWSLKYLYYSLITFKPLFKSFTETLSTFYLMVKYRNRFFWMPIPDEIYSPDFSIILTEGVKDWELRRININESDVYVCGNPFIPSQHDGSKSSNSIEEKSALIVHQPLYEDGFIDDIDWLVQQYMNIVKVLKRQDFDKIFIKLHPRAKVELYRSLLKNSEIEVIVDGNVSDLIGQSTIVIGSSSTVLINAIIQRKPTFITSWIGPELIEESGYGDEEVFDITKNLTEFENAISTNMSPPNEVKLQKFIEKHVGPAVGREAHQNMIHVLKTVYRNAKN